MLPPTPRRKFSSRRYGQVYDTRNNYQLIITNDKKNMRTIKLRNLINSTIVVVLIIFTCSSCSNDTPSLSVVQEFVKEHSEYGFITGTNEMTDWASGKRFEVITSKGKYLFYLHEREVVGIDKYLENGAREKVFKKKIQESQKKSNTIAEESLPAYRVLFQVDLFSGAGKYGEILISSFSKETAIEIRETTLRKILKKEGFISAALYSTEEAYQANSSEAYRKEHPDALRNGYLGQINENGVFVGK